MTSTDIIEVLPPAEPVVSAHAPSHYVPELVMDAGAAKDLVTKLHEVMRAIMRPDVDYGIIPGCDQPSLFQPGAEKLMQMFGLGCEAVVTRRRDVRRYDGIGDGVGIDVTARITKTINGHSVVVATGLGYCGHDEKKWGNTRVVKPRKGQDFEPYRTDIAPEHTILMMARKRAIVAGTRTATGASMLFTQDLEDMDEDQLDAVRARSSAATAVWPNFGEHAGKPLTEVPSKDLRYLATRESKDPKFKAKDDALRAAARAVLEQRAAADTPKLEEAQVQHLVERSIVAGRDRAVAERWARAITPDGYAAALATVEQAVRETQEAAS